MTGRNGRVRFCASCPSLTSEAKILFQRSDGRVVLRVVGRADLVGQVTDGVGQSVDLADEVADPEACLSERAG